MISTDCFATPSQGEFSAEGSICSECGSLLHSVNCQCVGCLSNECPQCKGEAADDLNTFKIDDPCQLINCNYETEGCQFTDTEEAVQVHIQSCNFRPKECPLFLSDGCYKKVTTFEIKQHLVAKHAAKVHKTQTKLEHFLIQSNDSNTDFKICGEVGIIENATNTTQDFFICMITNGDAVHWVILFIGPDAKAENYTAEVTISSGENTKMSWTIPILSTMGRTVRSYALEESVHRATCTYETLKNLAQSKSIKFSYKISRLDERPLLGTWSGSFSIQSLPSVFMDVAVDGLLLGRITMELRIDILPKIAENFLALCTGENGYGYKGSNLVFARRKSILAGKLQALKYKKCADLSKNGLESANTLKHDSAGVLGMYYGESGHCRGSEFYITVKEEPALDGVCVAFGRVTGGIQVVNKICRLSAESCDNISREILIVCCGQI